MQHAALKEIHSGETPQTSPVFGRENEMTKNRAGGFGFKMTDWDAFDRFLICGTEGGTFYVGQRELTEGMASASLRVLKTDGVKAVGHLVEISMQGRAASNDQALFLLAMAITYGNKETVRIGLDSIRKVVRTGSHLLHFVSFVDGMRGWGTGLRRAIQRWYQDRPVDQMIFQLLKYRQRDGWSQRDVLRKVHPRVDDPRLRSLFWFICHHLVPWSQIDPGPGDRSHNMMEFMGFAVPSNGPDRILDYIRLQVEEDSAKVAKMIADSDWLSHEMIRTEHKKSVKVNRALLSRMPLAATIRSLRAMTINGSLKEMTILTEAVAERIESQEMITRQRIHPFMVLKAIHSYQQVDFSSDTESSMVDSYTPIRRISTALERAYHLSFKGLTPIDKRVYIAVDISGSMSSPISEVHGKNRRHDGISCRDAAACIAQVIARTAKRHILAAFDTKMVHRPAIRENDSIATTIEKLGLWKRGGTDISQPMLDAAKRKLEVDAFIILTDGQYWAGDIHPFEALNKYRKKMGINAKMVNLIMSSSWETTVANPEDRGMLEISGMDASVPAVIHDFLMKE